MTAATIDRPRPRNAGDGSRALTRIDTHERVCAERWQQILARMDRMEKIMIGAAGTLIVGMGGLVVTLLMKGHP